MKKMLFSILLFLGVIASIQAQEIATNAIGIRVGDNDGFGTEVNYQRAIGDNNRVELGLGWRSATNFNAVRLTGLYQWVWNLTGDFNWYVGAGVAAGVFDFDDQFNNRNLNEFFLNAVGDIGIEYNFDFPLLLSLDFRPEIGAINDIDDGLEFDIALGIRYQF
ncbi:hypothetical protein [Dokdonia sp.]|uniref:hypothetical protein n=1 Tax=Dokdonia sp. TaxID=2024995 RepID=UPI0032674955